MVNNKMKYDLSILIPARNEEFLAKTIEDILLHKEGRTEVIAVLDGQWAHPGVPQHEDVTIIYHPEFIGQRAATNEAARLAQGKYVMKVDAHCSFDQGFDVKLINEMQDNWTMVPIMRNLHAFDWVCEEGHRRYQGPSGPCTICGKETQKDIVWIGKRSPQSKSYRFDSEPHFQYFGEFNNRPEGRGDITETMSLQGSCFLMTKERYHALNICDEELGSWGSQGIEVACKTWLSGGRVVVNHKTWYAHMFRTQGGDFGFPYPNGGAETAKRKVRDLFFNDKWPLAIHPLSWLVEKFWPVPCWTEEDLKKIQKVHRGVIYYTDNKLNVKLAKKCQKQLLKAIGPLPLVSVSLKKMDFGRNIKFKGERGYLTMFKQILTALENQHSDIVYFTEHDILYPPSHFEFVPQDDKFYYNTNVWKVRAQDGHAVKVDDCRQVSGLVCKRDAALKWYREKIAFIEKNGFKYGDGFEPSPSETFESSEPLLDIRHDNNLTPSRWSPDQFRNKKYAEGWKEAVIKI